jgi:hypothetical protein
MRKPTYTLAVVLVIGIVLTSVACGTRNSAFVGKWTPSTGGNAPGGFPDNIEFFSNGTIAVEGHDGTYSLVDGKLKLSASGQVLVYEYEIRGSRLKLTVDGKTVEYTKK